MAPRKLSPKKERKEPIKNERDMKKMAGYGAMVMYVLLCLTAVASAILFIIYSAEAHGEKTKDDVYVDPYEHDFGRMTISAYATIISLLGAILILLAWVAYNVHRHSGTY